eukprot:12112849-Alexandrium_andersonii.AAC.1
MICLVSPASRAQPARPGRWPTSPPPSVRSSPARLEPDAPWRVWARPRRRRRRRPLLLARAPRCQ